MLDSNLVKENLSEAYLMIVASVNGFSPERRRRDNDGVDIDLVNRGRIDSTCTKIEGRIGVQLKATVNWSRNVNDRTISYALDVKNYHDLRATEVVVPRILVVFCLPQEEPDWLGITEEILTLRKCAYWFSLRGMPNTDNVGTVTLRIPRDNLLTKEALRTLMLKSQREEDL